ncbi:MAG: nucleotidyltransferase family protein [Anaerolineales bacterium]|jgi:molybdenum cofactor cytidylyltransferase
MIGAVLLAAGRSKRMGQPKMALPWTQGRSILANVVHTFRLGGATSIVVVTGADRAEVEACLTGMDIILAHNAEFATGGMLSSVKVGLRALVNTAVEAALISPGDLPSLRPDTVGALIDGLRKSEVPILAPSFQNRRGHPLILRRAEWQALLELQPDRTLRDFLRLRAGDVGYLVVDDPAILQDLDTPEDYREALAKAQ